MSVKTIAEDILVRKRDFFISEVKAPLMLAIFGLSLKYPPPTKRRCRQPNSLLLIDAFDEILKHERNDRLRRIVKAAKRIVVGEYEHDGMYRGRIDLLLEKIVEKIVSGEWQPRQLGKPEKGWMETEESKVKGRALFGKIFRAMRNYKTFCLEDE